MILNDKALMQKGIEVLEEYDFLLKRFNKAFNYRYNEGSKADIEFRRIIKRLSELEELIKEG